jgi:serine/threonine-protein kinase
VAVILLLTRPWEDDTPTRQQPDPTPTPTAEATTPEPEPEPTETQPEEEPEQVEVVASDYIGRSASIVETELRAKGLKTKTETRDNPGDQEQDTVADLAPTGQVDPGTTITLQVWGEPPPVELPGNGNDNSGPGSGGNNGNGNSGQGSGDGEGD